MDMRGLILTRTGEHYITSTRPELDPGTGFVYADLATRGQVTVPRENVEAVEWYETEHELTSFRLRLIELRKD